MNRFKLLPDTRSGRHFRATCCLGTCKPLDIYAPKAGDRDDDLYEIGGVCGPRKFWAGLFRRVGIR